MTPSKYRFYNLPYAFQGVTFVAIVTLTRTRALTLRKGQASQADLAIERERQLITPDGRKPNNWLDQWQCGKLRTGSRD